MTSVIDVLQDLVESVHSLQIAVRTLNTNLTSLNDQQADVSQTCKIWKGWMENSSMFDEMKKQQQNDEDYDLE